MAGDSKGKQIHCEYFRTGLRPYSPHTDLGFKPLGLQQKEQGCEVRKVGAPSPTPCRASTIPN